MTVGVSPSVAHVLWSGGTGGIERLVHQLAIRQRKTRIAASVAFGQVRGPFAAAIQQSGIPVIDLALGSGYDLRPRRVRRGAAALARADVIHLHGFNVPLGAIVIASRRPVVFTEHGNFGAGRRIGIAGRVRQRAQRGFMDRACAEIAANSRWTAARAVELYGLDPDRVSVVHNGIDEALPEIARSPPEDERVVVSFVGRLAGFKRIDRMLRALPRLRDPDRLRVLIVGEGPLEGDLKALSARLGCARMVGFLGHRTDVETILAATDVLVQPSEGEPFGLAIVEACRQGALPIVFANGGGALEVLPPDGRVVADEYELARALDELIEDPDARGPARRRSRARWAVEHFSIGRTAEAYQTLYRSALGRSGR